jgi:hypothetical protein
MIKTYIVIESKKNLSKVKIIVNFYSFIMNFMSKALFLPILSIL